MLSMRSCSAMWVVGVRLVVDGQKGLSMGERLKGVPRGEVGESVEGEGGVVGGWVSREEMWRVGGDSGLFILLRGRAYVL